jgi:hypothetical protein
MAKVKLPTNDNSRLQLLKKYVSTATNEEDVNINPTLVPDELLDKGKTVTPVFSEKLGKINSMLSLRSIEIDQKQEALDNLNTWLRDFWEVLRRRTSRMEHPPQVLTHYQLPLSGITPKISRERDMLEITQRVIDGEGTAVAQGYPAMLNPTAAELQMVLDKAWKEVKDVPIADEAYDNAQEEIASLRSEVDELIRDMYEHMNFNLRKKDGASRRRIMQNYGFTFRFIKGESVDEEEISSN